MNPELQRNLWLDATPRRLGFAAATLCGVFVAVWLLDRGRHAFAVTLAGSVLFFAAALAWAPRAARESVTGEVRAGSWDFQRLCALTPWDMTWGKLAGATARPWLIAVGGLALAILQLASTTSVRHAAFWMLVALGLAASLQASGLATGLIDIRRARASGRPLSTRAPGLLLLVLALLSVALLVWVRARMGQALGRLELTAGGTAPAAPVVWFGRPFAPLAFAAVSLVGLAAWSLVWAWRLMRLELQFTNAPWAWAAFLACAGLYAFGFAPSADAASPVAARLSGAAGVWAALAYVAAFAEPADKVRARQFAAAVRGRTPARMLSHLPLPVLPSLLALAAGVGVGLIDFQAGENAAAVGVLAALAFFGRDLGLIAWRRFAGRGARGDGGIILLLLALYLAGAGLGRLFGGVFGEALFWASRNAPGLSLLAGALEAAVAWLLAAISITRPSPPSRARVRPAPPVDVPETGSAAAEPTLPTAER